MSLASAALSHIQTHTRLVINSNNQQMFSEKQTKYARTLQSSMAGAALLFFCDVLLSSLKWHKFVAPEAQQCGFRHISYIFAHYMYTCAYKNTTMSDK